MDNLVFGFSTTVIGMAIVFSVLVLLMVCINLLKITNKENPK